MTETTQGLPASGRRVRHADAAAKEGRLDTYFAIIEKPEPWIRACTEADGSTQEALQGKQAGCFVDARTGDIGPYIRWTLALRQLLRLLHPEVSGTWEEFKKTHGARALQELSGELESVEPDTWDSKAFYAAFRPRADGWTTPGRYLTEPLLDRLRVCLNRRLVARGPGQPGLRLEELTWTAFFDAHNVPARHPGTPGGRPTDHGQALVRFESWLRNGVHPPLDDLERLHSEHLLVDEDGSPDVARKELLARVLPQLQATPTEQPIVNIHSSIGWVGLRALATFVLEHLDLQRGMQAAASPQATTVGLIYVPLSRIADTESAPTPAAVVAQLRRAFGLPVSALPAHEQSIDLQRDLEDLRRALTIYPCTVVLDAVDNAGGPLSSVIELLRNTPWSEFIRVLVQPHVPTLRTRSGGYRSRFLVLSRYAMHELQPWAALTEPLSAPPDSDASRRLILDHAAVQERLAATRRRLGAKDSDRGMHHLYPLDAERLDLLFDDPRLGKAPSEVELTLACMLNVNELRAALSAPHGPHDGRAELRRRLLAHWLAARSTAPGTACSLVALQFVAASINGLRRTTLRRCLLRWLALARRDLRAEDAGRMETAIERCLDEGDSGTLGLVSQYPELLTQGVDEDIEAIGPTQRHFELHSPTWPWTDPVAHGQDRVLIDIRQQEMREMLLAEMFQPTAPPSASGGLQVPPRRMWWLIQSVLAAESLRQATAQLRNLHTRDLGSVSVYRRLVQAVVHGIFCQAARDDAAPPGRDEGRATRFDYLYSFLYKSAIENAPSEWKLGRSLSRSDLRYQLMRLFAAPDQVLAWQTSPDPRVRRQPLDERTEAAALGQALKYALERRLVHLHDRPALQRDIIDSLGRAALDAGRLRVVAAVVQVGQQLEDELARQRLAQPARLQPLELELRQLEASTARLRGLLGAQGIDSDPSEFARLKLSIDACLAGRYLGRARRVCLGWLQGQGIAVDGLTRLGQHHLDREGAADDLDKATFEAKLEPRVRDILRRCRQLRHAVMTADVLYRLGEVLAELADRRLNWRETLPEFLDAYAVYWIADRVRARATEHVDELGWPLVSARPVRFYIRISLKIARLLAEGQGGDTPRWLAGVAWFDHARERLELYSRHLYRLPRERLAMLLLLAASARVWAEMLEQAGRPADGAAELETSFTYVQQAERLALELGLPGLLARRLLFERIKTARRIVGSAIGDHEGLRTTMQIDFAVLTRLTTGSRFWAELIERQQERLGGTGDVGGHAMRGMVCGLTGAAVSGSATPRPPAAS